MPGLHLDIVHDGADRHRRKPHRVAGLHVDLLAGDHRVADGEALRREDVGELAVLVLHERDEGGAVGIVFETLDARGHVEFAALEIDDAIALLVAAALPAHGHAAGVVAAAIACLAFGQRLDGLALVKLRTVDEHQLALARRRRLVLLERHPQSPVVMSIW